MKYLTHVYYRSFSLSRSKKINGNPFREQSQEIVILLKINKEEMFCTNLQSSVWKRHVGAHQMCTNMAARKIV